MRLECLLDTTNLTALLRSFNEIRRMQSLLSLQGSIYFRRMGSVGSRFRYV